MTNLVVAIDDLHPEQGWGCEGDVQVDYLRSLNDEFGVKFTLFCPSYYHRQYYLTKDWVNFWLQYDWVELANHGHWHETTGEYSNVIGEQEFLELNYQEALERIQESIDTWDKCGYKPKGFRAPGWGMTQESADAVSSNFQWVAQHENINKDINFNCKTFYGEDGIHETENLRLYGNTFMFQSHIQGDWNDNIWNEKNYLHFQNIVKYLSSQYKVEFKTISEL